jgi:hypothetical protein
MNTVVKRTSQHQNRQRITQLSPHEKAAADSGGMVPRVSEATRKALEVRIRNEPKIPAAHAAAVLEAVEAHAGRIELFARSEGHRLSPAEIASQGRASAAAIREVLTRLDHMHPELDAHVTEAVYRARGAIVHPGDWLRPELVLLAAAFDRAAKIVDARPVKPGPIPSHKATAIAELAETLRHSLPKISKKDAVVLGRELIEIATGA